MLSSHQNAASSSSIPPTWISADLCPRVQALMTTREGGVSQGPYAACNLGDHVGDLREHVDANRALVAKCLDATPVWLTQVHGNELVRLSHDTLPTMQPVADGAYTTDRGIVCTVMVADCLPILLAAPDGKGVAALHAGWRGLAGAGSMLGRGIAHTGVEALCTVTQCDPIDLKVWLGPCIGTTLFEVGEDVLKGFGFDAATAHVSGRFQASSEDKWMADLPGLAQDILLGLGVRQIEVLGACTVSEPSRFFSFRRDRVTGRQAACIRLI